MCVSWGIRGDEILIENGLFLNDLWALMGISTTSLVGTPMIQSVKKRKEPDIKKDGKDVIAEAADEFGELREDIDKNREGLLYGNKDISNARFTDMAKVQMFREQYVALRKT
jgi:hypothetical protein